MNSHVSISASVANGQSEIAPIENGKMDNAARIAGLLYLVVIVTGIFNLMYLPSRLYVSGDAAATVGHIVASGSLFRLGIVADLVCYTAFLLLPLALYRLLSPAGRNAAALMVAFAVVQVPIAFVNAVHEFDVLSLVGGAGYLHAFSADQLNAQVMSALDAYRNGLLVLEIFSGLWLLPFGYLVFKCGFLPRVLGIALMLGCLGYLIDFAGSVLFLGYPKMLIADVVILPASFGEIGICLWLLIMGARSGFRRSGNVVKHASS